MRFSIAVISSERRHVIAFFAAVFRQVSARFIELFLRCRCRERAS
jgi:hypothetical protein